MRNYNNLTQFGWYGLTRESAVPCGGDVWYVDGNSGNAANNASSGQGESWDSPFANINYAISRCSDDAGNVILVAADHTETITATGTASGTTTSQLVIDKNGVTIIGLGTGDRRPTITIGTAVTAEVKVDATEVTLKNLLFVSALADLETLIEVATGANCFHAEDCEFRDGGASLEAIDSISLAADCDDAVIRGCRFITSDTGSSTQSAIAMAGGVDRMVVQDNFFYGDWGGGGYAVIEGGTAASIGVLIDNNVIYNLDATKGEAITMHANTTGFVINNTIYTTNAASSPLQAAKCVKDNNKITSVLAVEAQPQGSSGAIANGNHFYVDSGTGVDTATGLSWHDPLATVDAAIGKCTHDYGDTIHVAAGHTEDITGATIYLFDMDVRGVSVVGEGQGDLRPTFSLKTDATNGIVDVTAADCRLENLRFLMAVASLKYCIYANTSADDLIIRNCEFAESGQTGLTAIMLGGGDGHADNVLIEGCRIYTPTAGNQDNAIEVLYDMTGLTIRNNYIMGNFDEAAIEFPAGGNACQDIRIENNTIINEQAGIHCIEIEQTALTVTGVCANNLLVCSSRAACLQPNILNCYGNVWMDLGGNKRPVILEGDLTTPGQNIYVNSAHGQAVDDTAHGTSWDFPLATIEYANTNCVTANNNDVIHVGPGHEETISDSVYLDFDTAGVTCIGYGNGNDRPIVTFDHANAVVDIGAHNITLKNLIFRASVNGVAVGVDVLAGFDYCKVIDCDFGPPEAATDEFAIALQINAGCDYTEVAGCKFMAGAQAAVDAIKIEGASDHVNIHHNVISGAYSTAPILGGTAASTYLDIHNNIFMTTGSTDTFNLVAASTGFVRDNRIVVNAADFAAALDIGNCWNMNNYKIADDDVGGAKCDNRYTAAASVTETADG